MESLQNIGTLISANRLNEALAALDARVAADPRDHEALYMRGRVHWRLGDMRRAMTDYSASAAINPDGPASLALGQTREILDFYCKDIYNP